MKFWIRDNTTGKQALLSKISTEEWVRKGLIGVDIEGWAISEEYDLYLLDECGNWIYADQGRFEIISGTPEA